MKDFTVYEIRCKHIYMSFLKTYTFDHPCTWLVLHSGLAMAYYYRKI